MDNLDRPATEGCDSGIQVGRQRTATDSWTLFTPSSFQEGDRSGESIGLSEPKPTPQVNHSLPALAESAILEVALLTGGDDKSYALGITSALVKQRVSIDFIGSDKLDAPELHTTPLVNFLNLRGDQRENVGFLRKVLRILGYYWRLVRYAAAARPPVFHILWNNKFQFIDRVLLMLYYRLLGKKIVFTAHNVNAARRDSQDTIVNRASLRIQYHL